MKKIVLGALVVAASLSAFGAGAKADMVDHMERHRMMHHMMHERMMRHEMHHRMMRHEMHRDMMHHM